MIEFKKFGMKIAVGLGEEAVSPVEREEMMMKSPYRIWIGVDGLWAPTTFSDCAYRLAERLKAFKSEDRICEYIEEIVKIS